MSERDQRTSDLEAARTQRDEAAGGIATEVGRSAWERHKANLAVRRHDLFFLYEANRRIVSAAV